MAGHGALWFGKYLPIIWERGGCPQPARIPARRPARPWRAASARAQASVVAPEVRTSSIRTTRRPWMSALRSGGDLEGALHIAGALRPGQPDLLLGRPDPPQRLGGQFDAALARNHPRQRAGLVVAAAPAAPPVQGNRHQHVGLGEQFLAGARHPAAHRGRQIGAVLVFQRMHQRAGDVVIAHRGAGALVGRRIGDRLHRQQFRAGIVDKGNAEPRTERRRDERQFRPARRADALAIDRLAAGNAQRRQRDVERELRQHARHASRQAPSAPRRWLEMERGGDASASMGRG